MRKGGKMVKVIQPKTEKAAEFIAEHGDKFIPLEVAEDGAKVLCVKTNEVLTIAMIDGMPYINGQHKEW